MLPCLPSRASLVRRDVTGDGKGILELKLSDEPGKKNWNSAQKQQFWEKYEIVRREARLADVLNAKLLVGGLARYEITSGEYHFREFKVAWNEYEGILRPTDEARRDSSQASNRMLPRTLEPEVMDTAEEAADYDAMDHSTVNRAFVDEFLQEWNPQRDTHPVGDAPKRVAAKRVAEERGKTVRILDVGTGTALIPIELARRDFACHITAVDLAEEMLKLARRNIARAGLEQVIQPQLVDAKGLPYPDAAFDAVMSNSIVHHIPSPRGTLAEMLRVLRPGGILFVRDLLRPETGAEVEHLVDTYAVNDSPRQQQLFRQSLHAALTLREIGNVLLALGLPPTWVRQSSDRHWTIAGKRT